MRFWGIFLVLLIALAGLTYVSQMQLIHGPSLQPTVETDSLATSLGDARADFMTPLGSSMAAMDAAGATSVIVIQDGRVLAEWGDTGRVSSVHSVRKSIVGILYGIAEARGLIDVSKTMAELGVDEQQTPLTVAEKSATLHDLLTSRSGIYHPSVNDDGAAAPRRGSHAPDAHFYYNNWSFNALGGIFEQETGLSLNEAFRDWIAGPTGMQDVDEHTVRYDFDHASSVFPAYRFWLSGRDMARFGLLVLNDGVWEGQQIIPREWLQRSFMAYSENVRGEGVGYGYLWWLMPGGVIMATGTGGQKLWLDPDRKLLIATRVDTGDGFSRGVWWQFGVRVHNGHLRALHQDMIRVLEQDS